MTLLIIPGLFFLLAAPMPGPPAQVLADFSRFSKAINEQIAIIEADGTEHEGVLTAADGDQISLGSGSGTKTFSHANVSSAERMRDGRIDGAIKGALFGLFLSAMASQGLTSADDANGLVAKSVVSFAATFKPSLSLSFRF